MEDNIAAGSASISDDDDPVVEEIDVFLSKSLVDNLYVMQYPMRPKNLGYDNFDHMAAKVKPQQKKVELTLALDTHSKNYSSSKGEHIANNVDGSLPYDSRERFFTGPRMNKIAISSQPATESFTGCQYAAGLIKNGELHMTPLNAIVQMRPNLNYLDTADVRCKAEAASQSFADGGESSQDEGEEEATVVNMKLTRGESEEFRARRMASYEYIHQKREEERWIPLSYFPQDSGIAETERERLKAAAEERINMSQFKLSQQEYLQALIPPSNEDKSEAVAMPDNVLSLNNLRKLDLSDQIKALLINVKVIRWSQLLSFLSPGVEAAAVLRCLQAMAVLVQGCWVAKSELLYPDEEKEDSTQRKRRPHSAVSPELLRRVRDYAMWKFTHCKYVVRKDISSIVQLPSDDVKEILEKMSRLRIRSGWEFLYEYDREFVERFPEIVQRQRSKWALTFHTLAQYFKMPKDGDKKALEAEMALMNLSPVEKHRTRRRSARSPRKRTVSGRSVSDVSDMELDTPDKSLLRGEDHEGVNGAAAAVSPRVAGGSSRVASNTLHVNGGGDSLASRLGGDISVLTKELEGFVHGVLAEINPVSMSELRSRLSLLPAPQAAVFSRGVSDRMIEDAVVATGGFKLNNQWPSKVKQDPLFAALTGDERKDKLRHILFKLFEDSPKFRFSAFKAAISKSDIELSDAEMKKFLKEHCDTHAALYYLKRTLHS